MENHIIVEKAILNLISDPYDKDNCFYGHIIAQCYMSIDDRFEGIAGVGYWDDKFHLYINPNRFNSFTLKEQKAILVHESMHIIFNHFSRQNEKDHERWNIATDAAINQFIPNIPKDCIFPETLNKPQGKHAEYYYEGISKKIVEKCCLLSSRIDKECSRTQYKGIDSHKLWGRSSIDENNMFAKEVIQSMLDDSIEKTIGHIPVPVQKALILLNEESQVPWQKILKRIMGNSKKFFEPSYKKVNRRFINRIDLLGKKTFYIPTLVCIVDVSRSMSDKEILKGIVEIQKICKLTQHKLVVIQVDTQVQDITNTDFKDHSFLRYGCGGTDLYPAIEYVFEKKIPNDIFLFITDGYFSFDSWEIIPKISMFFLITSDEKIELPTKRAYQFELK